MSEDSRADRMRRKRHEIREEAETAKQAKQAEPDKTDEEEKKGEEGGKGKTKEFKLKEDFEPRYLYLPEDTNERMDAMHDRLVYELRDHVDFEVKKGRDTFRTIVEEGLTRLEEMESEEIAERLREKRESWKRE